MNQSTYHSQPIGDVLRALDARPSGLSYQEAELRLKRFGSNTLPEAGRFSALVLFFHQFKNPLIFILFAALAISFATQHYIDAWIILTVILISSVLGFLQEYQANRALLRLKHMVQYRAKVLRDGREHVIAQEALVPGDIIILASGDKIPADARVIKGHNFEVIEAALTGESVPSSKRSGPLPLDTPLADRENMIYLGTIAARGTAKAVVTATGLRTEIGRIATLVKETKEVETPLQQQLRRFGRTIGIILVAVNALIFGLGIAAGKPLFEMFLTSVAVVVAAVPEGLLPAMTVILAISMQRLARRKGLVRRMLAAETLGSVTVICTDKTGTLTQGEMRVSDIVTETARISHDGTSFSRAIQPDGDVSHVVTLKIGLLCNNAIIENPDDELHEWVIMGDPDEKALLLAGRAAGLKKEELEVVEPRVAEVPFDSEYKFMATLHTVSGEGRQRFAMYVKGAPERVLNLATAVDVEGRLVTLTDVKRRAILEQHEGLTRAGLRVLAAAYRITDDSSLASGFSKEHVQELVFTGLLALKDPLRPDAKEALDLCVSAGIRPIIVTGDHRLTAMAIVSELGILVRKENVMECAELDALSDQELREAVKKITVFARVEPKHKIRIVVALQQNGEVVAMTGDGVNDAPALKKADIGIAVGSGTDVAKETADLVLLDDSFQTIVEAVRRGRITFNNLRKVILYLLDDSFTEMTLIGGAVVLGFPLPLLPAQILWIKLIEDTSPAMALSFDEAEEDVMREPPRRKGEPILNMPLKKLIAFYAVIMDLALFGLFYAFLKTNGDLDYARTVTFVGLGFSSIFYIYAVRGLKRSIFTMNPFSNKFLVATTAIGALLFFVAIYVPFFNRVLRTAPLGWWEWSVLCGYAALGVVVYEIGKKLFIARASARNGKDR